MFVSIGKIEICLRVGCSICWLLWWVVRIERIIEWLCHLSCDSDEFLQHSEDADHWDNEKLDNMGTDSDYDSNSIRASLLRRWRVRIPIKHTLSLSLSLSLSLLSIYSLNFQFLICLQLAPRRVRQAHSALAVYKRSRSVRHVLRSIVAQVREGPNGVVSVLGWEVSAATS